MKRINYLVMLAAAALMAPEIQAKPRVQALKAKFAAPGDK